MADTLVYRCGACGGINRVAAEKREDRPVCGRCKAPLDLSGHPADISDDALERLVASAPVPVLVDFWAPWCGPCRMVAPVVEEVAARHAGRLIVAKLNTDEQPRTAGKLGVQGIPTFAVYREGQVVAQRPGALSKPQLEAFISPHL